MAQTSHKLSVSSGGSSAYRGNTRDSFNTHMSAEDAQVMRWLSPLRQNSKHQEVRTGRLDGVGDWLLERGEWREWRDNEDAADKTVLFCSGNLGVGKTYLSSLVIDTLRERARHEDIAIVGLYCDFPTQQEQTVTNIMGAILGQLVSRGGIPDYLRQAFQKRKEESSDRGLRLVDLIGMLKIAIASLPKVFICLDALDECLSKYLPEFLESLRDIVRESPGARLFLTGRPHIWEDVQRYFPKAVSIPINPNADDIRNYLEMRLDRDPKPEAMSNDLRADIVRVIMEKISDIFLLVSLNIETILGEVTIRQRRKKLEEMALGNGLGDAYTATLTRLKAQKGCKSELGLKVLMWVLYSERPLRAQELTHALGIEIGSADLDPGNVPALGTLLSSCLGLVTVEACSSTVRLVHFTLQEHLSSDPTLFHSPHSTIAEVCLTYLNFRYVSDLLPTLSSAPATTPLLEYASVYWGRHARRGMTENIKILALRLLDRFDEHISTQLLLLHYNRDRDGGPYFHGLGGPTGFTGLHGAALLGISGIVSAVLDMKEWDVNENDCMGMTALTWASRRGHEEVVRALLEREDVNPNQADTEGQTPLSWAARKGHEGVVNMLLGWEDVSPSQPDSDDQALLMRAASNGHERMVKMLLEREDVNPDKPDMYGKTPLCCAALNGHPGVVKMLLERGSVSPDKQDNSGQTPLWCAALNGHGEVVKILLEREDVNPEKPNNDGQAPLFCAALNGQEEVVKILLERNDVDPDKPSNCGQTPLSCAAENGHEGVVKILLKRGDVDTSKPSNYGRTPFWWAAWSGHEGVVKTLLRQKDVNPDKPDNGGETPLCCAAKSGHEGVVKILLERDDVNPNRPDNYDQTPLWWAIQRGNAGVVALLQP